MDKKETKDNETQSRSETPLFRKEVIIHKKGSFLGKTVLVSPISFSVWIISAFCIALAIVLFLTFGKYVRRQAVQGILVPDKGIINIYAKNPGIVTKSFIHQGDQVKKGQLLYLISTEQETLSEKSLSVQQINLLEQQIEMQKIRINTLEKDIKRYDKLLKQHFISEVDYQKRYDEFLAAKIELQTLIQNLNQAKGQTDYAIRAPRDGVISVSIAMQGDRVTLEKHLATIIPEGAKLQGRLFVPSRAIGFVKPGQRVLLKYQAYPYQRFGLHESTITSVDKSIILPQEITLPIHQEEPFYRVIVSLKKQTVTAYGKPYSLTAGMLIEAVILGEERNLWQWIMDPVFSLRGSLAS